MKEILNFNIDTISLLENVLDHTILQVAEMNR